MAGLIPSKSAEVPGDPRFGELLTPGPGDNASDRPLSVEPSKGLPDGSFEVVWQKINDRPDAAASTVEALVYALLTDGIAALERQRFRLLELSSTQLEDVVVRLARLRGTDDELVLMLAELLP